MTYGCGANDDESSATSSVSVRVEMADEYDGQEKPSPQNPEVEQRAGESTGELDLNGGTNAGVPAPMDENQRSICAPNMRLILTTKFLELLS